MRILWSMDAFDDPAELVEKIASALREMARRATVEVDPAFVISPVQLGLNSDIVDFSYSAEAYQTAGSRCVTQKLKDVGVPGLGAPKIILHHKSSLRGSVEALASYAAVRPYDLIVAGSHGRSGISRLALGSFAEELLLQAQNPVLVLGPRSSVWEGKTARMLLANDLSGAHEPFFNRALGLAKVLGAEVTLLNVVPRPAEPVLQTGVYLLSGGWVSTPHYLERERFRRQEGADAVLLKAREMGVSCRLVVDDDSPSVVESVLRHATSTEATLVAMAARSGPVSSALLGSVTRQVARQAPCPVWVYRERA